MPDNGIDRLLTNAGEKPSDPGAELQASGVKFIVFNFIVSRKKLVLLVVIVLVFPLSFTPSAAKKTNYKNSSFSAICLWPICR